MGLPVGLIVRPATDAEIARVYRIDAQHLVAVRDGEPIAAGSIRRIDGRLWALYDALGDGTAPTQAWTGVVIAIRRHFQGLGEPVWIVARDKAAARFLCLLGFAPTDEYAVGKRVWVWRPERRAEARAEPGGERREGG